MKLSKVISVHNILRTSGTLTILVGAPMILVPPLMTRVLFGKRESQQPDKNALNLTMQAVGIALTGSGVKSIVTPASRQALGAALYMEASYACYHCSNTCFGRWKDASANMKAAYAFLGLDLTIILLQIASLCWGDKQEKED